MNSSVGNCRFLIVLESEWLAKLNGRESKRKETFSRSFDFDAQMVHDASSESRDSAPMEVREASEKPMRLMESVPTCVITAINDAFCVIPSWMKTFHGWLMRSPGSSKAPNTIFFVSNSSLIESLALTFPRCKFEHEKPPKLPSQQIERIQRSASLSFKFLKLLERSQSRHRSSDELEVLNYNYQSN